MIQKFLHFTAISALLVCSACADKGVTVKCGDGSLWLYKADGTLLAGDGRTAFRPTEVEGRKKASSALPAAARA